MRSICLFLFAVLFTIAVSLTAYQAEIKRMQNDVQPYTTKNMLEGLDR